MYDHDFLHAAEGVLYPHGLYDLKRNVGHLYLGLSHDTSQFACDNVYRWWMRFGRWRYPDATSLLLLCDCGGSNDYRRYLFKQSLQVLADRLQLVVRVAHYPPYEIVDDAGNYDGFGADYLRRIGENTGLNFKIITGLTWAQIQEGARNGTVDMIAAITPTRPGGAAA